MKSLLTCCLLFTSMLISSAEGKKSEKKKTVILVPVEGTGLDTYNHQNSVSRTDNKYWSKTYNKNQRKLSQKKKSSKYSWSKVPDLVTEKSDSSDEQDNKKRSRWGSSDIFRFWSSFKESNERKQSKESHDHSKESHDHSKASNNHSKESRNKRKKHSRKHSESSSKRSSSKSSSGDSSEGSGWIRESSEEKEVSASLCEKWCWKLAMYYKKLDRLFRYSGHRSGSKTKYRQVEYCQQKIEKSGCKCNYNESVSRNTTTSTEAPTTTELVPTERSYRRCKTDLDCEMDECCLMKLEGATKGLFCSRHLDRRDFCTADLLTSKGSLLQQVVPKYTCPCRKGLRCESLFELLRIIVPQANRMTDRSRCMRVETTSPSTTPTTDRTTQITIATTGGSYSHPVPETNSTETPQIGCNNHMDCPFLQCCTMYDIVLTGEVDESRGVCMPLAERGDFCTEVDSLLEASVIAACPCNSFLKCSQTNKARNGAFGICVK